MRDALSDPETAYVLITSNGKKTSPSTVTKIATWHGIRAGVGLKKATPGIDAVDGMTSRVTPHCFRRAWATIALNDEKNPTPIDVKEAGSLALVTGIYRIYETGVARTTRIREAIAQGHHVVFGMEVDRAYEEWRDTTAPYPGLRGPSLGGHAQVLVGYAPGRFLVLNSWGPAWGEDGYAWIAEEALEGEHAYDFSVVTVAPTRPV